MGIYENSGHLPQLPTLPSLTFSASNLGSHDAALLSCAPHGVSTSPTPYSNHDSTLAPGHVTSLMNMDHLQHYEPKSKLSIETLSENVAGIFNICKEYTELHKEELELRKRSAKAKERLIKIQEIIYEDEKK